MYAKGKMIQEAVGLLRKAIGKGFTVTADMIDEPPKPELGNLAFPCFEYAKGEGRNPVELATELAVKIGPTDMIEKITSAGPYVNFHYNKAYFGQLVLDEALQKKPVYGNSVLGDGKKVLVEYAQPNTHKEFHIGHVRSSTLGQAIANILRANGYDVVPASYIGDAGADVAKALWGLKKFHGEEEIEKESRVKVLGEVYTKATQYVADHPEAKEEISQVQQAVEAKEEPWFGLWKETRQWSLDYFKGLFKELNILPEHWYFESEVDGPGKEVVKKLLVDGIAKKSQGATIIDLEDEDLGVFLVLKSDGTALYSTMDLALALRKEKEHAPDRQIFVVDVRQSLHFQQLFATLRRMGFAKDLIHIPFEFVTLPEGAMSSRKGTVVKYVDLRDEMIGRLIAETASRHEDWSEKKVNETASQIARAAITFMMLRQDPNSVITFDMEEAMSVDGFTGPYILYTIARIERLLGKTKVKPKADGTLLTTDLERELVLLLADFPAAVERAGMSYQVSIIAQWAFETAKCFAEYYHATRIIDEEADADVIAARLALAKAVQKTLQRAMELLAIDTVDEM